MEYMVMTLLNEELAIIQDAAINIKQDSISLNIDI